MVITEVLEKLLDWEGVIDPPLIIPQGGKHVTKRFALRDCEGWGVRPSTPLNGGINITVIYQQGYFLFLVSVVNIIVIRPCVGRPFVCGVCRKLICMVAERSADVADNINEPWQEWQSKSAISMID